MQRRWRRCTTSSCVRCGRRSPFSSYRRRVWRSPLKLRRRAAVVVTGSSGKVVHIPMDNALYDTEGLVLTGPVQLRWMQQLLVCLCGIWIRVSCGSTCISMYFNVSRTPHFGYASDTLDTDCIHVSDAGCMGYRHTSWIRTDTQ